MVLDPARCPHPVDMDVQFGEVDAECPLVLKPACFRHSVDMDAQCRGVHAEGPTVLDSASCCCREQVTGKAEQDCVEDPKW